MLIGVEPRDFPEVVRKAPDEFLVLYAPFESWGGISPSAVIRRGRTGFLRRAGYSYTLKAPGSSAAAGSADDLSRSEVVDRMISDNLQHNEGRSCWVEF